MKNYTLMLFALLLSSSAFASPSCDLKIRPYIKRVEKILRVGDCTYSYDKKSGVMDYQVNFDVEITSTLSTSNTVYYNYPKCDQVGSNYIEKEPPRITYETKKDTEQVEGVCDDTEESVKEKANQACEKDRKSYVEMIGKEYTTLDQWEG